MMLVYASILFCHGMINAATLLGFLNKKGNTSQVNLQNMVACFMSSVSLQPFLHLRCVNPAVELMRLSLNMNLFF
jgi:hypothetical protein